MSDGARHVLAYVAEVTYGTTPGTPSMIAQRHTSCDLALEKDQFVSQELNGLRQVSDLRHGTKRVGGGFGFEYSHNAIDDFLEALLGGTWSANILKVGTTRRSFSIERQYPDLSSVNHLFKGCEVNTLDLSIRPNAIVTGAFGFVGQTMSAETAVQDASLTAAPTNAVMDSFTGTISEGGGASTIVTGLDLKITNNLQPRYVVGSALMARPGIGLCEVTGRLSAYFENATLMAKWITETNSTLQAVLSDGTKTLTIDIPRLNYTSGTTPTPDAGPVMANFDFRGTYDVSDASTIKFTRSA